MQSQKRSGKIYGEIGLTGSTDKKRISCYNIQVFWVLLATFTLSLSYEAYRAITRTGITSFDTFNTIMIIFYLVGFGMAVLVRTNQRWAWWLVLLLTLALIAIGTFYYDPVILPVRHPDLLDWFESVTYLGLLFIAAYLSVQQLRCRILVPGQYPPT